MEVDNQIMADSAEIVDEYRDKMLLELTGPDVENSSSTIEDIRHYFPKFRTKIGHCYLIVSRKEIMSQIEGDE